MAITQTRSMNGCFWWLHRLRRRQLVVSGRAAAVAVSF